MSGPYLKFASGQSCAFAPAHGDVRWIDTGQCVECARAAARLAYRARVASAEHAAPSPIEPLARAAKRKGEHIYQSNVWCSVCQAYPHRITDTQHCMICYPDEVNEEARRVALARR